jgi:hypothetical protein
MAEHSFFTPAVRSWKSLSGQELRQELPSLGLVLDMEEKVIICTKCRYALKPSDAVSKHFTRKSREYCTQSKMSETIFESIFVSGLGIPGAPSFVFNDIRQNQLDDALYDSPALLRMCTLRST